MEANRDKVTSHDLRHDRHTVSLLTDHLVFSPKYRGKVLEGEIAEAAEEIIRETCTELDIEVIDMAVNMDHVHLFNEEPCGKPQGIIQIISIASNPLSVYLVILCISPQSSSLPSPLQSQHNIHLSKTPTP